jgi:predicted membrane protein
MILSLLLSFHEIRSYKKKKKKNKKSDSDKEKKFSIAVYLCFALLGLVFLTIFRVVFPSIFLIIISLGFSYYETKPYKRSKKSDKEKKLSITAYLCCALLGLILSMFFSLDLVFKDYISITGIYESQYRDRNSYKLVFDVNGENDHCSISRTELRKYDLQEGQSYDVVYAKRTGILISIKETD